LDGAEQLNSIPLIGMANSIDIVDEALLCAGRLEVHMEISLTDKAGRAQILEIHTAKMRANIVIDCGVDAKELAKLTMNFFGLKVIVLVN
jgi:vesicle-fusing ATPase